MHARTMVAFLLLHCGVCAASDSFVIARNGRAIAKIVTAPEIDRPFDKGVNNQAVRDLIRVIGVMSGASLPAVQDTLAFNDGPQIHVGQTEFVKRAGLIEPGLPANAYRVVLTYEGEQARLVLAGPTALGTSNAVYDLLTRELGVIWGMENQLFEDIPRRQTVEVGPVDRTVRPPFPFFFLSGPSAPWQARHRLSSGGLEFPYMRHGHNVYHYFPVSRYRNHPEYYPLVDGRRKLPERDGDGRAHVCYTNPEVVAIMIEAVRWYFDANPQAPGFSLCAADDDGMCSCDNCSRLDNGAPPFRGRERIYSDSYFAFVDTVAKAVLQSHPDRYLSAYAYDVTEPPPRHISRLPRNVVVYLTQDATQHFDEAYREEDERILDAWKTIAEHVCLYEYTNLGWFLPRNFASLTAKRIRYLSQIGIDGYYAEAHPHPAQMAPVMYLTAKLAWDPALNAEDVLDEWYQRMFREAAPHMKSFYVTLDSAWMHADRRGAWFAGLNRMWEEFAAYPPRYREVAWRHLDAAMRSARDETTRMRVQYVREGHEPAYRVSRAFEWAHSLNTRSSEDEIVRVLSEFERFMETFFRNVESNPDYADIAYRGARFHERTKWIKLDILRCIDRALAGRPEMHARLLATNATFSEMDDTAKNRRTRGYRRWTNRDMETRGVFPSYIADQPPYLPSE